MKSRIEWIDIVKIIACFLVIILHSISIGLNSSNYYSGLWIYYLGVFAIPLFFLVNGYLQLAKEINYHYVIKKVINIILVVVFWGFVLILMKLMMNKTIENPIISIFGSLFQKGLFPHFWFLGALIIIDILLPLLQQLYRSRWYNKVIYIMIIICSIMDILYISLYKSNGFILKNSIIQTFRIWTWLLYFLMGGYIKKYNSKIEKIKTKNLIAVTIPMIILSVLYQCLFANKLYGKMYCESFYDSIIIIITSILIFVSISRLKVNKKYNKYIENISNLTMGVYIIHVQLIALLLKLINMENNYQRIILLLFTFLLSLIISYVISKIPIVNKFIKI